MEKGWKQTWENLLFQHFEIEDKSFLEKYLPKDIFDTSKFCTSEIEADF